MRLVATLLSVFLMMILSAPVHGGAPPYHVVSLGQYDMQLYTHNGLEDGNVTRFNLPSWQGQLRVNFLADSTSGKMNVFLTTPRDSATVTWVVSESSVEMRLQYPPYGTIHAIFYDSGDYAILENTVTVCSSFVNGEVYRAVHEAVGHLGPVLAGIDFENPVGTDTPLTQAYGLGVMTMAGLPNLIGCESEAVSPNWGGCVQYTSWQECAQCCERSTNLSIGAGAVGGLALLAVGGPAGGAGAAAGGVVALSSSLSSCLEDTCGGKPGDPEPTTCTVGTEGELGVCALACPLQNGGPSPECDVGFLCCPATSDCPSPFHPGCGICNFAPDNYCCQNPTDPFCPQF